MGLYVFDAYGTLFDVHAAAERHKDAIGPAWQQLSQTWRTKHIEYSWHVTPSRASRAMFWRWPSAASTMRLRRRAAAYRADVRGKLLAAYRTMDAYPEVREVLAR